MSTEQSADATMAGTPRQHRKPHSSIVTDGIERAGARIAGVTLANGERMAAALPVSRLAIIPDCGHSPMEERPRELLAELLPFLDAQPAAGR